VSGRIGQWGCTANGWKYWPTDPRPGDIETLDIAHALSLQCRFGGHVSEFYSVAQHSVAVSFACDPADALWGLLHDASEAYIVDIPRPLKYAAGMEGYVRLEQAMMRAVCERFGLPLDMPESVRYADEVLLATEARDLMPHHGPAGVPHWGLTHPPLPDRIACWSPTQARIHFLDRLHDLVLPATEAA
jgi:hypothetical protein